MKIVDQLVCDKGELPLEEKTRKLGREQAGFTID
jgi:hypothetical protein